MSRTNQLAVPEEDIFTEEEFRLLTETDWESIAIEAEQAYQNARRNVLHWEKWTKKVKPRRGERSFRAGERHTRGQKSKRATKESQSRIKPGQKYKRRKNKIGKENKRNANKRHSWGTQGKRLKPGLNTNKNLNRSGRGLKRKKRFEEEEGHLINFGCVRPNAEKLVRKLYRVCEKSGFCINQYLETLDPASGHHQASRNINEIFARFSYISPRLMIYITSDKFRQRYMYDGKNLVKNNNSFSYIGQKHLQFSPRGIALDGLEDIDGAYPDPFYRIKHNITCTKVEHTIHNCFGKCRPDNCNENPPTKDELERITRNWPEPFPVPNIQSISLYEFIRGDFKDFEDPFLGQMGFEVLDGGGRVMNADGSKTTYQSIRFLKDNKTRLNALRKTSLARVSKWDGVGIWDGIGNDPYKFGLPREAKWDRDNTGEKVIQHEDSLYQNTDLVFC